VGDDDAAKTQLGAFLQAYCFWILILQIDLVADKNAALDLYSAKFMKEGADRLGAWEHSRKLADNTIENTS
jgi:hypothetical protein